jgi:hypothetical protein
MANIKAPLNGRIYPPKVVEMATVRPGYVEFLYDFAKSWPKLESAYVQRRNVHYHDMFERLADGRPARDDIELFVGDMAGMWMFLMTPPALPVSAQDTIDQFWAVVVDSFASGKPELVRTNLDAFKPKFDMRTLELQKSMYE